MELACAYSCVYNKGGAETPALFCIILFYVCFIYRPMDLLNKVGMKKEVTNAIKGLVDREDMRRNPFKTWPNTRRTEYELEPTRPKRILRIAISMIGIGIIGIGIARHKTSRLLRAKCAVKGFVKTKFARFF